MWTLSQMVYTSYHNCTLTIIVFSSGWLHLIFIWTKCLVFYDTLFWVERGKIMITTAESGRMRVGWTSLSNVQNRIILCKPDTIQDWSHPNPEWSYSMLWKCKFISSSQILQPQSLYTAPYESRVCVGGDSWLVTRHYQVRISRTNCGVTGNSGSVQVPGARWTLRWCLCHINTSVPSQDVQHYGKESVHIYNKMYCSV